MTVSPKSRLVLIAWVFTLVSCVYFYMDSMTTPYIGVLVLDYVVSAVIVVIVTLFTFYIYFHKQ